MKGGETVTFADGETSDTFSFGTVLNYKVEKIGFTTVEDSHTIWDEAINGANSVTVPSLQDKTEVISF